MNLAQRARQAAEAGALSGELLPGMVTLLNDLANELERTAPMVQYELVQGSPDDPAAISYEAYTCDRPCVCGKVRLKHEWRAGWLCCSPDTSTQQFTGAPE